MEFNIARLRLSSSHAQWEYRNKRELHGLSLDSCGCIHFYYESLYCIVASDRTVLEDAKMTTLESILKFWRYVFVVIHCRHILFFFMSSQQRVARTLDTGEAEWISFAMLTALILRNTTVWEMTSHNPTDVQRHSDEFNASIFRVTNTISMKRSKRTE
jgi:hypothetical protein